MAFFPTSAVRTACCGRLVPYQLQCVSLHCLAPCHIELAPAELSLPPCWDISAPGRSTADVAKDSGEYMNRMLPKSSSSYEVVQYLSIVLWIPQLLRRQPTVVRISGGPLPLESVLRAQLTDSGALRLTELAAASRKQQVPQPHRALGFPSYTHRKPYSYAYTSVDLSHWSKSPTSSACVRTYILRVMR